MEFNYCFSIPSLSTVKQRIIILQFMALCQISNDQICKTRTYMEYLNYGNPICDDAFVCM